MTLPDSGETVPGLAYGYAYDDIGNRTGETLSGRIGSYVTNVINAYTSRNRSRTLPVMGIANANAVISVNTVTASRLDAYWMGNVAIDGNDAQSVPVSVRGDIYEGEGESLMSARSSASSAGILSATRMETTTGSGTSHGLSMSQLRALSSSGSTVASAASRSASSAETESLTSTAYETRNGAIYTPRNPESFSYDEDGNLLSDGTWVYTWDAENRLIGMENTNDYYVATGKKQKLAFAYDETGRRVEKKVWSWNSGAWILDRHHRFLYDGWNMMAQLDGNNGNDVLKTFTWGQDISGSLDGAGGVGGLLDVQDYGIGGCSFYMYDGNGNVMGLTGYFGGFDAEYAYDPYGGTLYDNPIYSGVTKDNPFRFSTKYLDFETGLYYYGYRYYNPDQGRWINRDPIEEEGGLNLYAFVGNEPVGNWDWLGLMAGCRMDLFLGHGGEKGDGNEQESSVNKWKNQYGKNDADYNTELKSYNKKNGSNKGPPPINKNEGTYCGVAGCNSAVANDQIPSGHRAFDNSSEPGSTKNSVPLSRDNVNRLLDEMLKEAKETAEQECAKKGTKCCSVLVYVECSKAVLGVSGAGSSSEAFVSIHNLGDECGSVWKYDCANGKWERKQGKGK